jgi:DNA-binding Lrp family transcriptional regulator
MKELKSIDYEIVSELIKNSRLSDRQLAKILKTSQPTVTRRRRELEKERLLDYTAIPDLKKLGFEILAITFGKWKTELYGNRKIEAAKDFLSKHPNIIFVSTGMGIDYDRVAISFHKTYSDYSLFMRELMQEWEQYVSSPQSFIISLRSDNILRNLTFKHLAKNFKQSIPQEKL